MEYSDIAGVSKPVSRLVQGTVMLREDAVEAGFALLDAALEYGINTFDTAHVYGGGASQRVLGMWLKARGVRDRIVILDKGAHTSRDRDRVTPYDITADLHDSLARIGVENIDMYLLHRDDPSKPVGPIVECLNEHREEGLITVFGGSNWSWRRIQEANEFASANGLEGFTVSSPHYSLAEALDVPWAGCRSITGDAREDERRWYIEGRMPVIPWSSLCGGFFSGRFSRNNLDSFTDDADRRCIDCYASEENFLRLDRAGDLAERKGRTTAQIALAYLLCGPVNCFPIMAGWTDGQIMENAGSTDIQLGEEEMGYLNLTRDQI